jgi:hypothetical protein
MAVATALNLRAVSKPRPRGQSRASASSGSSQAPALDHLLGVLTAAPYASRTYCQARQERNRGGSKRFAANRKPYPRSVDSSVDPHGVQFAGSVDPSLFSQSAQTFGVCEEPSCGGLGSLLCFLHANVTISRGR